MIWPFRSCEVNGESAVAVFEADLLADEAKAAVADERAGEQAGFHQNLKAVADAEDRSAVRREFFDNGHDRREASPQGWSCRARHIFGMHVGGERREVGIDGVPGVVIAVAAREDEDSKFHVGVL
jgi:hypothetical protein